MYFYLHLLQLSCLFPINITFDTCVASNIAYYWIYPFKRNRFITSTRVSSPRHKNLDKDKQSLKKTIHPSNKPTKKIRFHKKTHYSQKITQKSNINTIKIQFFSIFLLYLSKKTYFYNEITTQTKKYQKKCQAPDLKQQS